MERQTQTLNGQIESINEEIAKIDKRIEDIKKQIEAANEQRNSGSVSALIAPPSRPDSYHSCHILLDYVWLLTLRI